MRGTACYLHVARFTGVANPCTAVKISRRANKKRKVQSAVGVAVAPEPKRPHLIGLSRTFPREAAEVTSEQRAPIRSPVPSARNAIKTLSVGHRMPLTAEEERKATGEQFKPAGEIARAAAVESGAQARRP